MTDCDKWTRNCASNAITCKPHEVVKPAKTSTTSDPGTVHGLLNGFPETDYEFSQAIQNQDSGNHNDDKLKQRNNEFSNDCCAPSLMLAASCKCIGGGMDLL